MPDKPGISAWIVIRALPESRAGTVISEGLVVEISNLAKINMYEI
jgi:hypothetical protein